MLKNWCILKTSLFDIRNEWSWYLILMIVNPLALLLFLTVIGGSSIDFYSYIVGSIVMTFGTGIFLGLGQTFSYYKASFAIDYYLALPISKNMIILSLILRNVILSIPSTIVLIIIGVFIYHVHIVISFPLIISILLTSISLAGVGTLIGVCSRSMQMASILTQILVPIFNYLAPVFLPKSSLPEAVSLISYLLPTTYAANSLRAALYTNSFSIDFIILFLIGIVSLFIVTKMIDWRNE